MNIFPAIDLRGGKVVRLLKGDYNQMTVYGNSPLAAAENFEKCGAKYLHIVDLDGAKDGTTPNSDAVREIIKNTSLKVEIGGGIRSEAVIKKYIDMGVMRVILGTVAITEPEFTTQMIKKYGEKIAVGIDISDGRPAIKGWTELCEMTYDELFLKLQNDGVRTVICTDISKDGAMCGTNIELYCSLSEEYKMDIVASGGVSTMEDIKKLKAMNIYGAILGKALYTGSLNLKTVIEVAK